MTAPEPSGDFLVMAKPAGARCNLACAYCYYLPKAGLFPQAPAPRMDEALLETYIRQRLEASPGPATHFEWHGGEPTLLGLDYFRRIVQLQKAHGPAGRTVSNGLQTNGTLLDADWARFLAAEGFSVGLSLDGPPGAHDRFRTTRDGHPTQARTVAAFHLLRRHRVHVDLLCVLHAGNAEAPQETYGCFRDLGATHLQFLPLVQPLGGGGGGPGNPGPVPVRRVRRVDPPGPGAYHHPALRRGLPGRRRPAPRPVHLPGNLRGRAGAGARRERVPCDHYVDPDHRLGNLREEPLDRLARLPEQAAFGRRKRDALPSRCRACDVLAFCNGGCPKDRLDAEATGEPGVNRLCPAYRRFFRHARPALTRLAAHWRAGKPLATFGQRRAQA